MPELFDLVIRGAEVVGPDDVSIADIAIRRGRIADIRGDASDLAGVEEVDATGLIATVGGIDTHTHVEWPHDGRTSTDTFRSATKAAVLGGTTTVVDFVPPSDEKLLDRCASRVAQAQGESYVDFAFHPILTAADRDTLDSLGRVIEQGFTSFKMYTTYEDRRIDDGAAWQLMRRITAHGGTPGFHAENHELLTSVLEGQVGQGTLSVRDFPASRPALAEAEAIQMVAMYARKLRSPVYIFHVSGAEALDAVRIARSQGTEIYAETCTHYLTFDETAFAGPDPWRFVITPPLRQPEDRRILWNAIDEGLVTSVGSDHCAYDRDFKAQDVGDHRLIPAGAPGIEARTPMLWHGTRTRGLGLGTFSQISAERAGRVLGLENKGKLAIGYDADIVLWEPRQRWSGFEAMPASPETFSLYTEETGWGAPRDVLVRGRVVVRGGELTRAAPHGRLATRARRVV